MLKLVLVNLQGGSCNTVNPLPALPLIAVSSTSPVLYCQNETAIPLSAIPSLTAV
jgi:hypothetical protein